MKKEDYIGLFYKSQKEPLSEEERQRLEEWRTSSAQNAQELEEIAAVWNAEASPTLPFELDTAGDFDKLMGRIQQNEVQPRIGKTVAMKAWYERPSTWLLAAASLLLLLIGPTVLKQFNASEESQMIVASAIEAKKELNLPDGSKVWLNKGSELSYAFSDKSSERRVELKGEAFFEVTHDASRAFIVHTKELETRVLGTEFAVKETKEQTNVYLQSGKVEVRATNSKQRAILSPSELLQFHHDRQKMQLSEEEQTNMLAWKRGSFIFRNASLEEVLEELMDLYEVKIDLSLEASGDCAVTGRYSTDTELDQLLKNLSRIHQHRLVKVSEGHYRLDGGDCS